MENPKIEHWAKHGFKNQKEAKLNFWQNVPDDWIILSEIFMEKHGEKTNCLYIKFTRNK